MLTVERLNVQRSNSIVLILVPIRSRAAIHYRVMLVSARTLTAWYTMWPILCEFMRVTTHSPVMNQLWTATQAWAFGDTDFHPFPFLEVVDPFR